MNPSIKLSAKTIEGLSLKIKNLAIVMGFEKGDLQEEDEATGVFTLEISGRDMADLQQNVYSFSVLFPVE